MIVALWLRFLGWPAGLVGLLIVIELVKPSSIGLRNVVATALAGYAVGAVIPLFHWDEILHLKFATITAEGNKYTVTFDDTEHQNFATAKELCFMAFVFGLVLFIATLVLPQHFSTLPYPLVARYLWLVVVIYFFFAGVLFVYIRSGRPLLVPGAR